MGTSGDYPPFTLDGEGFDVEVARRFAADLGRQIEWIPFRWPELATAVAQGRFDIAMSGVTWRPERDVAGWMTRSVARSGPCVVGPDDARRIAVNRGGILESWARHRFPTRTLLTTADNRSLPELLRTGAADAFVTDSFEVRHFALPGDAVRCEPAIDRKVYWVAPASAAELGPRLDAWLRDHERALRGLRTERLGDRAPLEAIDHLVDLLGRRLELMPAVARWKRAGGLPIEDLARERLVLESSTRAAVERGLDATSVESLFRLQIELAKAIQSRADDGPPDLDLDRELRPAILRLGERIVDVLAELELPLRIEPARLELLSVHLTRSEIDAVATVLESLCRAEQRSAGGCPVALEVLTRRGREF